MQEKQQEDIENLAENPHNVCEGKGTRENSLKEHAPDERSQKEQSREERTLEKQGQDKRVPEALKRERIQRQIDELRPMDDAFMRRMFRDNIALAQHVLRIITGIGDLVVETLETQRDLKQLSGAKSVILDVYATDSNGRRYDLEIQKQPRSADSLRASYYASILTVESLSAGQDYGELPEIYVIFIMERDIFGKGKPLYHIESVNLEAGTFLDDHRHVIFVNGEYAGDDALGTLMHDFNCMNPNEMRDELMRKQAKSLKENEKGVIEMGRMLDEMLDQAREDGKKEGKIEGRKEGEKEGMDMLATMIVRLSEQGRSGDIERVVSDRVYREQMLAEFSHL